MGTRNSTELQIVSNGGIRGSLVAEEVDPRIPIRGRECFYQRWDRRTKLIVTFSVILFLIFVWILLLIFWDDIIGVREKKLLLMVPVRTTEKIEPTSPIYYPIYEGQELAEIMRNIYDIRRPDRYIPPPPGPDMEDD